MQLLKDLAYAVKLLMDDNKLLAANSVLAAAKLVEEKLNTAEKAQPRETNTERVQSLCEGCDIEEPWCPMTENREIGSLDGIITKCYQRRDSRGKTRS